MMQFVESAEVLKSLDVYDAFPYGGWSEKSGRFEKDSSIQVHTDLDGGFVILLHIRHDSTLLFIQQDVAEVTWWVKKLIGGELEEWRVSPLYCDGSGMDRTYLSILQHESKDIKKQEELYQRVLEIKNTSEQGAAIDKIEAEKEGK